jgi:hypothetical protein
VEPGAERFVYDSFGIKPPEENLLPELPYFVRGSWLVEVEPVGLAAFGVVVAAGEVFVNIDSVCLAEVR